MTNVFFRCDGDARIGLGHLTRCVALAHMLKAHFRIVFFCRSIPEKIAQELAFANLGLVNILDENAFFLRLRSDTIVVLDGYHFTSDYQKAVKALEADLVCIDDLHDNVFYADMVINHAPGIFSSDYRTNVPMLYALGPDYSLLRPAFLNAALEKSSRSAVERILICFGGSDPKNLTKQALQTVIGFSEFQSIVVVTGAGYTWGDDIKNLIESDPRIEYFSSVDQERMVWLFKSVDVAIIPASGTLVEAIACGVLPISGAYSENQTLLYNHYKSLDCFIDAQDFGTGPLQSAIRNSFCSPIKGKKTIDGKSGERLLRLFFHFKSRRQLRVRAVALADLEVTYRWATNPLVRAHSFQKDAIQRSTHEQWFNAKLSSPDCFYYMGVIDSKPVGSIRFDIKGDEAVISYLLDPEYQGKGIGLALLTQGIKRLLEEKESAVLTTLVGYVMPANKASIQNFKRLGFQEEPDREHLRFVKSIIYE